MEWSEALPEVRELSGGPPGGLVVVGRPSQCSVSGWETLSEGRDALTEVREWSGDLPGGPGVDGKPFRRCGSGREALSKVWEWSSGHIVG